MGLCGADLVISPGVCSVSVFCRVGCETWVLDEHTRDHRIGLERLSAGEEVSMASTVSPASLVASGGFHRQSRVGGTFQ
jgi:hypothetical protein